MSSIKENLQRNKVTKKNIRIGIVKSIYNTEITNTLFKSCVEELKKSGIPDRNISTLEVPGAYELPYGCKFFAESKKFNIIIAIGAVIKGETPHFNFIAQSASTGIMNVGLKTNIPVILGILTTNTLKQAKDRIKNGKCGDKGKEAAQSAIMLINNLSL